MQRTLRIITKINCIPRFFSTGNNTWKDRDSAVEKDYFNKEDGILNIKKKIKFIFLNIQKKL